MQHKGAAYANTNLPIQEEEDITQAPMQEPNNAKMHMMFGAVLDERRICMDQTGRFPHHSRKGTNYLMVLYCYDANAIVTEPLKNRTETELNRAYKKLYEYLKSKGYKPETHWLDNEAPAEVKKYNQENNTIYKLVPSYVHQHNAAEQTIRTFKKHFKAILA
eukprot:9043099-Ditylum_brightwellii.AAC.1